MRPSNGADFPYKMTVVQHTYCLHELFLGLRHFGSRIGREARGTVYMQRHIFFLFLYDTLDYFVEDSG